MPPRKRRASPRAIRFASLQVGDQLMQTRTTRGWRGGNVTLLWKRVALSGLVLAK